MKKPNPNSMECVNGMEWNERRFDALKENRRACGIVFMKREIFLHIEFEYNIIFRPMLGMPGSYFHLTRNVLCTMTAVSSSCQILNQ